MCKLPSTIPCPWQMSKGTSGEQQRWGPGDGWTAGVLTGAVGAVGSEQLLGPGLLCKAVVLTPGQPPRPLPCLTVARSSWRPLSTDYLFCLSSPSLAAPVAGTLPDT